MRSDFKVEVVGINKKDIEKAHEASEEARKIAEIERQKAYRNGLNFHQKSKAVFTGTKIDLTKPAGEKTAPDGATIKYGPR